VGVVPVQVFSLKGLDVNGGESNEGRGGQEIEGDMEAERQTKKLEVEMGGER